MLMNTAMENNYEHYEISNFARNKNYSKHNTSYWQRKKYLGVGPSAHSFDGESRQWNIYNNAVYIRSLAKDEIPFEREELSKRDKFNEYILTSLRTQWGINIELIRSEFGEEVAEKLIVKLNEQLNEAMMTVENKNYILTRKGKFFADKISLALFE